MRRLIAPLLFFAASCLFAADPNVLPLSLEEATRRALAKNQDIAIEREALVQADEAVNGSKGAYDPFLGLDTGYRQHTDPVNSQFSGAPPGALGPETKTFNISASLSQLLPTGGSISVITTAFHDETNNKFTILSPAWSTAAGIALRQPLLQNRSIDPARQAIRIAAANRGAEAAHLKRTITETVAAVESTYWLLEATRRAVEVIDSSVELARQQLSETQSRVDAGVLARTDLAQPTAELERRRGNLAAAREAVTRVTVSLKLLILADPADPDWEREITPTDEPSTAPIAVDLPAAIASALKNRPEITEAAAGVTRTEIDVEARQSDVLPKLDLVAAFTGRGLAGSLNPYAVSFTGGPVVLPDPINGGLGRSLGTIGENRFPDASVGLSFTLPILNRAAKAGLATAKSQERQARLASTQTDQRIASEVRNAATGLDTARERLETSRAARAAAETQLFAEQERFQVGLSTNFLVLTRQNELTTARVTEIQAQTDFRRTATELARSTGTLLEERHIRFSEAEGSR
jgi:outer membrane protein